jgi:hypothetical protein
MRAVPGKIARLTLSLIAAGLMLKAAQAAELTFALKIESGRVPADMRLIRVKQGDVVRLQMISDRREILHLHGYDIEWEVNGPTQVTFTANLTGRFPIHLHSSRAGEPAYEEMLVDIEVDPH